MFAPTLEHVCGKFCAERACTSRKTNAKNARVQLACTTKSMRFRREISANLQHVCSVIAATKAQHLRRHLRMFSADSSPNAHAPRAKTNAKLRAFGRKAWEFGKEKCARLLRLCRVSPIDDKKCVRRHLSMFAANFAPNARGPRAKEMQKTRALKSAGVHHKKYAISTIVEKNDKIEKNEKSIKTKKTVTPGSFFSLAKICESLRKFRANFKVRAHASRARILRYCRTCRARISR